MYTHDDIWQAIDKLAAAFGYSASGLAKQAGLDPTTFNRSKRHSADGKPRWPSTESIAKILSVTGANMQDFTNLIDRPAPDLEHKSPALPMLDLAQAGQKDAFDDSGFPAGDRWDHYPLPGGATGFDAPHYALKVSDHALNPLYRAGDILIINPAAPLHRGDRVIVKTAAGEIMGKELAEDGPECIELKSFHPGHDDYTLRRADLAWMARIMWVSQ